MNTKMWWTCPNCNNTVDFSKNLTDLFKKSGEAEFGVNKGEGIWVHHIFCDHCKAAWQMGMTGIILSDE